MQRIVTFIKVLLFVVPAVGIFIGLKRVPALEARDDATAKIWVPKNGVKVDRNIVPAWPQRLLWDSVGLSEIMELNNKHEVEYAFEPGLGMLYRATLPGYHVVYSQDTYSFDTGYMLDRMGLFDTTFTPVWPTVAAADFKNENVTLVMRFSILAALFKWSLVFIPGILMVVSFGKSKTTDAPTVVLPKRTTA